MAQKFVGLDLGTQEVKLVLVSAGLRTAQVLEVHEEAVMSGPQGDDSLDAALEVARSVLRKRGWDHYPVGVVLPGGVGSYRVLRFPFGDPRRIAQAIQFEIEGQFPVPIETLDFDHVVVGGTKVAGQALVAAVRRDLVKEIVDSFKAEKIDLKVITVPPLALAQALEGPIPPVSAEEAAEGKVAAALIVDIGHKNSELVAVGPKGPLAARSLRRGGFHVTKAIQTARRLDVAAAEAVKVREGYLPHDSAERPTPEQAALAEVIAGAFEPIVREIAHTRLWLRSEFGCEVTVLRVCGGGAALRGCEAFLAERCGVAVEHAMPRESATLKKVAGRDWSSATAALGVALAASRRPLIQLYREAGTREGEGSWLTQKMSTIAAIGLGLMAFGSLDTVARIRAYEAEEAAYAAELGDLTKAVFGEEVLDAAEIEGRLGAVGGRDLTKLVASRSAIDVLNAIVKVVTPKGPRPATPPPNSGQGEGDEGGASGEGEDALADGSVASPLSGPIAAAPAAAPGAAAPGASPGGSASAAAAPQDANAGLSWDDDLTLVTVEIRPRKIELTASATRLSAQARLKRRLQSLTCITNIQEGRARDENDRKVFEMSIEHDCLYQPLEEEV